MTPEKAGEWTLGGASALLFAMLGVSPAALLYAAAGLVFGSTLAKPSSRPYAIAMFMAGSLLCALFGTLIAERWFAASTGWASGVSGLLGLVFHPALATVLALVPSALSSLLKRLIGEKAQP